MIQVQMIGDFKGTPQAMKNLKDGMMFISNNITEELCGQMITAAKYKLRTQASKHGRWSKGNLEQSIQASKFGSRYNTGFIITAGGLNDAPLRPSGNMDPGKYYAYYQEVGFTPHYVFVPWLFYRAPISEAEAQQVINNSDNQMRTANVTKSTGKYYMKYGFTKGLYFLNKALHERATELGFTHLEKGGYGKLAHISLK